MNQLHFLVALPDTARRQHIVQLLHDAKHRTLVVGSADAAADALDPGIDVVLLDLSLPDLDIMALRRALSPSIEEPDSLDAAERRHLALVLRHTAGNKRRAAHILGISRSTLLNKVRKYQLESVR